MLSLYERSVVSNEVAKWAENYAISMHECDAEAANLAFAKLGVAVTIARSLIPLDYKTILNAWGVKYDSVGYVTGGVV